MNEPAGRARASADFLRGLVDEVGRALGEDIRLLGLAPGGEVGAAFVRRADGRESVLSLSPGGDALRRAGAALDVARRRGLLVPTYQDVVDTADGTALLQERLAGHSPQRVDDALVDQMLQVSRRLRGLLAGGPELDTPDLHLDASGPGFCLHESLERHSARSRRLLRWVRAVGAGDGSLAPGEDLVHLDFHPGNVLVGEDGRLSGVIDWDAAGRGDARLAFTTLLFDLDHGRRFLDRYDRLSDTAVERVRSLVEAVEVNRRRMFWAHMSLRQVDWSIRFHSDTEIEHYLEYAFAGIERFDLGGTV